MNDEHEELQNVAVAQRDVDDASEESLADEKHFFIHDPGDPNVPAELVTNLIVMRQRRRHAERREAAARGEPLPDRGSLGLFSAVDGLVEVVADRGTVVKRMVDEKALALLIHEVAGWQRMTNHGLVNIGLPAAVRSNVFYRMLDKAPRLRGMLPHPVIGEDGRIMQGGYYDGRLGVIVGSGAQVDVVPFDDSHAAMAALREAFSIFEFAGVDDVLRLMLLPASLLLRLRMEEGAVMGPPLFVVTAPDAASGKTTAAMMAIFMVTGVWPAATPWTGRGRRAETDEEMAKVLAAAVDKGAAALIFDNVPRGHEVSSDALDMFVTQARFEQRRLGTNTTISGSATFPVVITGNNLVLGGYTHGRAVVVSLRGREEMNASAEALADHAKRHRPRVLGALEYLLRSGLRSEHPPVRLLDWARLVDPLVAMADAPMGLLSGMQERIAAEDETGDELVALVEAMVRAEAEHPELAAESPDGRPWWTMSDLQKWCRAELTDIVNLRAPRGGEVSPSEVERRQANVLAKSLSPYRDMRLPNGWRLVRERMVLGERTRRRLLRVWRAEPGPNAQPIELLPAKGEAQPGGSVAAVADFAAAVKKRKRKSPNDGEEGAEGA